MKFFCVCGHERGVHDLADKCLARFKDDVGAVYVCVCKKYSRAEDEI